MTDKNEIKVEVKPDGSKVFSIQTGDMSADEVGRYLEDFIRSFRNREINAERDYNDPDNV